MPALVSIAHRLSGLALVFVLPLCLMVLSYSLTSEEAFFFVQRRLHVCWMAKTFAWGSVSAWIFHALAGVRHLLMDLHLFESLPWARRTAVAIIGLGIALSLLFWGFLWV